LIGLSVLKEKTARISDRLATHKTHGCALMSYLHCSLVLVFLVRPPFGARAPIRQSLVVMANGGAISTQETITAGAQKSRRIVNEFDNGLFVLAGRTLTVLLLSSPLRFGPICVFAFVVCMLEKSSLSSRVHARE
jgi:hypothetical protein